MLECTDRFQARSRPEKTAEKARKGTSFRAGGPNSPVYFRILKVPDAAIWSCGFKVSFSKPFFLLFLLLLNSCAWIETHESRPLADGYDVGWIDFARTQSINRYDSVNADYSGFYTEVVEAYVYAVGHDSNFIIAKQHPDSDSTTAYFIIDIKKNRKAQTQGVYGPLTAMAFDSIRRTLNIERIGFDLKFEEYPE